MQYFFGSTLSNSRYVSSWIDNNTLAYYVLLYVDAHRWKTIIENLP